MQVFYETSTPESHDLFFGSIVKGDYVFVRNYSAIVLKKVQTNSKQKANANPIVDAVG